MDILDILLDILLKPPQTLMGLFLTSTAKFIRVFWNHFLHLNKVWPRSVNLAITLLPLKGLMPAGES